MGLVNWIDMRRNVLRLLRPAALTTVAIVSIPIELQWPAPTRPAPEEGTSV